MTVWDFDVAAIDGRVQSLRDFQGRVLLIVNVASACGYTPQYAGLERLFRQHKDQGLVVLGFPCNQFGRQEPGTNAEIAAFCAENYDVTFPMFAKIDVNGARAHPLFTWLKSQKKGLFGGSIKWNFTKFLVDRDGQVVKRFGPSAAPDAMEAEVTRLVSRRLPAAG